MRADSDQPTFMHYNVASLYQLGSCPAGAAACAFKLGGAHDKGCGGGDVHAGFKGAEAAAVHRVALSDATFVLGKEGCLMFADSCGAVALSKITFQGRLLLLVTDLSGF
ncbi:MAG: hypothetical protein HC767_01650 [Akkermansiaceae bacterium]|nr:hypothetical protein [Akkermansiaceae bacterium]